MSTRRKFRKRYLILPLLAVPVVWGWLAWQEARPKGEGSWSTAVQIRQDLEELKAGSLAQTMKAAPVNEWSRRQIHGRTYEFCAFEDGSWMVVTGTDSHKQLDGGTVGILTSTGELEVGFTHVCGEGAVEATFWAPSASEALAKFRRGSKPAHP